MDKEQKAKKKTNDIERRSFVSSAEVRETEGEKSYISGIAARFDEFYDVGNPSTWGFRERIARGAFDGLLEDDRIVALVNHNSEDIPLARNTKTMKLTVGDDGLRYEIEPPNSPLGQNAVEAVRRGDLPESSFAFKATEETWVLRDDGVDERTITKFERIFDVSVVSEGANRNTPTEIAKRSRDAVEKEQEEAKSASRKRRLRLLELEGKTSNG